MSRFSDRGSIPLASTNIFPVRVDGVGAGMTAGVYFYNQIDLCFVYRDGLQKRIDHALRGSKITVHKAFSHEPQISADLLGC